MKDAGGGRAEKPDPDGQRGEDDRTFVSCGNRQVCGTQEGEEARCADGCALCGQAVGQKAGRAESGREQRGTERRGYQSL